MTNNNIVWFAPNLNHYRIKLFNKLTERKVSLIILSGRTDAKQGHIVDSQEKEFLNIEVDVSKENFNCDVKSYRALFKLIRKYQPRWVHLPIELKFLPIIVFALILRSIYKFELLSYNHPIREDDSRISIVVRKICFKFYDKIIFYTQKARERSVSRGDLEGKKAYFANNTLEISVDNDAKIKKSRNQKNILFIGRLLEVKRIDLLLQYFEELQHKLPTLKLHIIGDGPLSTLVDEAREKNNGVIWHGALVKESKIAPIFKAADIVFVPGHSGLSINHALIYGKPYITLKNIHQPPEIDFLEDNINGLLLEDDFDSNVSRIYELLTDSQQYEKFSTAAFTASEGISSSAWCDSIESTLYSS